MSSLLILALTSTQAVDVRATPYQAADPSTARSVASPERLDEGRALGQDLGRWADEVAGARVLDLGGAGAGRRLTVRGGAPSQALVVVDGVVLRSPFATGVQLAGFDPDDLEHAELQRGGQGTLLGDGALTGALVVNTGGQRPRASLSLGTQSTLRILAAGATDSAWVTARYFRTSGRFDYTLRALALPDEARTRENNDSESGRFSGGGRFRLGAWRIDARVGLSARHAGAPGLADSPTESRVARQRRLQGQAVAQAHRDLALADGARFTASAALTGLSMGFRDPSLQIGSETTEFYVGRTELGLDLALADHLLRARGSAEFETVGGDILARQSRLRAAVALVDEFTWNRLTLIGGLRVSGVTGVGWWPLPRLAVVFDVNDAWRLRLSGGRSLRTPTLDELYHPNQPGFTGNPSLRAETSWEASGAVSFGQPWLQAEAVGFTRLLSEGILYLKRNAFQVRPENVGSAHAVGGELEASTRHDLAWFRLAARASASLLHSRVSTTQATLPGLPTWSTFAGVTLSRGPLTVGTSVRAFGETNIELQPAAGNTVPAYARWDAHVIVRPWSFASVGLTLNNLLDARTLQSVFRYPLPGRTAMLTVRVEQPKPDAL